MGARSEALPQPSRPKVKRLIFVSLIWIPTFKVCYNFMRVFREFAHNGLCLLICLLKEIGSVQAKSHRLHYFSFFHCGFSNVSSSRLPERMHSHIGCICLAFLHCAFSNVSSNCLLEKRQRHIGCICLTFLRCAFWNVSSKRLPEKRQSHIGCICLTFLHFDFSNVSSNCLHEKLHNHIVCFKTKVFNVCIGKAWASSSCVH